MSKILASSEEDDSEKFSDASMLSDRLKEAAEEQRELNYTHWTTRLL
jgi:hypothetical protein